MPQAERKIYATLTGDPTVSGLVGTRVYPFTAPQDVTLPYVTYFRAGGTLENGFSGYLGTERPRIQIDCWAATYAGAKALALAVRGAMDAATTFSAACESDRDGFEDTDDFHRVILDFIVCNQSEE